MRLLFASCHLRACSNLIMTGPLAELFFCHLNTNFGLINSIVDWIVLCLQTFDRGESWYYFVRIIHLRDITSPYTLVKTMGNLTIIQPRIEIQLSSSGTNIAWNCCMNVRGAWVGAWWCWDRGGGKRAELKPTGRENDKVEEVAVYDELWVEDLLRTRDFSTSFLI